MSTYCIRYLLYSKLKWREMKCEHCEPVEEDEAGHLLYAVLVGELAVGRLDEVDVLPVGVVVDVLQRLQDGQARRALLLLVWMETTSFRKLFNCNSDNLTTRRGLVSLSSSSDTHCSAPKFSLTHKHGDRFRPLDRLLQLVPFLVPDGLVRRVLLHQQPLERRFFALKYIISV